MRVKEPLNGFRKAQGQIVFQIAMLASSFILLEHPMPIPGEETPVDSVYNMERIIFTVRCVRGFIVLSKMMFCCCDSSENKLLLKILRGFEIFSYMAVILFEQFFVILHPPREKDDIFVYRAKLFMVIEVLLFYSLIAATIAFLVYIQIRGMLGYKNYEDNKNRFKYDALDYYETDIIWFQFQVTPIILHVVVYLWHDVFNSNYVGDFDHFMMAALVAQRVMQVLMLSPFRGQDKRIRPQHIAIWFILTCVEGGAFALYIIQDTTNGTSMVCIIDVLIFVLQFLYQWQCQREQEEPRSGFVLLRLIAPTPKNFEQPTDELTDTNVFQSTDLKINDDIYSLAFAALVHPDETENDLTEQEQKSGNYMKRIDLLNDERENLYYSAIIVVLMQFTTIYLILVFFSSGSGLNIVPALKYEVVIPRLTSSIMMHLIVEPDIRDGIQLMKYALNHPQKFRVIRLPTSELQGSENKERGLNRRVFAAFLLGLCQSMIGIIAEVFVILFLSTQSSLLDIIRKFVSMSVIVKFDDMYASALSEHAIKKAKGKKLKVTYKRRMSQSRPQANHVEQIDEEESARKGQEIIPNPRQGYYPMQVMNMICKTIRIYYVSFGFYFLPISAMLLNFLQNTKSVQN